MNLKTNRNGEMSLRKMLDFLWKPRKKLSKSEIDDLKEYWNNIDTDLKKIINEKMQFTKYVNYPVTTSSISGLLASL